MEEIWKNVYGFENIYQVSNLGNVKALERDINYGNRICHRKERLLSKHFNTDGYYTVKLKDNKNHAVHRLVAEAFISGDFSLEVDHIDGDRTNNNVNNLRWVTHYENLLHTYELGNGHMSNRIYDKNYNSKPVTISNEQEIKTFDSLKKCAEFIKEHFKLSAKVSSIYDSLRKHNISKKPYYNYYINY